MGGTAPAFKKQYTALFSEFDESYCTKIHLLFIQSAQLINFIILKNSIIPTSASYLLETGAGTHIISYLLSQKLWLPLIYEVMRRKDKIVFLKQKVIINNVNVGRH